MARSQLLRSLVILGALLGLFALHSADARPERAETALTGSTAITLPLDAHGAMERLEQVAMVAPITVGVDTGAHLQVPWAALLFGSALLLGLGVVLSRQRFGDAPLQAPVRQQMRYRAVLPDPPDLTRLCILRT
ncbi:hypothetical protein GCM10009534_72640 [Kribbella sandramycini]